VTYSERILGRLFAEKQSAVRLAGPPLLRTNRRNARRVPPQSLLRNPGVRGARELPECGWAGPRVPAEIRPTPSQPEVSVPEPSPHPWRRYAEPR
jgi:hypothetical protein